MHDARARQPGACALHFSPYEDLLISPGLERQAIADLSADNAEIRRAAQSLLQYGASADAEQAVWEAFSHPGASGPQSNPPEEFGLLEALTKATGWTLTSQQAGQLGAMCVSNACRQEVSDLRRWLVEPIAIDRDEWGYARMRPVPLRSRAQLEQKIAQFPSGTKFVLPVADGSWYSEQRHKETAAILEKAAMQMVDSNGARSK
ncbi:MAG: hypothetical protein JOZ22_07990 [Acidobacteriia bacterium]|nr:hypothetical protein [Terriglobia bacterium]